MMFEQDDHFERGSTRPQEHDIQERWLAITQYERCLVEASTAPMQLFVQDMLSASPPRLITLLYVAQDINQRLRDLHTYRFEVHTRLARAIKAIYGIDLMIANYLVNNVIDAEKVTQAVVALGYAGTPDPQEALALREVIHTAADTCQQLWQDICLTEQVYHLVTDWLEAHMPLVIRDYLAWQSWLTLPNNSLVH